MLRVFHAAAAVSLTLSAVVYFLYSWRWPLVGDASLIHYIGFLIERGWAPYRQLGDMNMPGSYLVELAAMHIFGPGDLAWRCFDFALLITAVAAFIALTRRKHWLAPVFCGSLFVLVHGRDGLAQGGQRDLTMAVCLIVATAFLAQAVRTHSLLATTVFGLLSGLAFTIKPTAILLSASHVVLACVAIRRQRDAAANQRFATRLFAAALLGWLAAPAAAFVFLLREHAVMAFLGGLRSVVPYYAGLGHRPLTFVLVHSLSTLEPLIIAWLLALCLREAPAGWADDWERNALIAGVLFGLLNCIAQQRALPYYRYPLLAFLLPLIAIDLTGFQITPTPRRLRASAAHAVAVIAIGFGAFFLAPRSAVLIHRYHWWQLDFISTLQGDLAQLGGPSLSGHIQCIDSISGCGNVLYRMRLEPATGVLSDFLLFGNPTDREPPSNIPIIQRTRAAFTSAVLARPPQVIVVSSHLHIDGGENFSKLARWPEFASFLATRYRLTTEWHPTRTSLWWSRPETPASYRIYVLRTGPGPGP